MLTVFQSHTSKQTTEAVSAKTFESQGRHLEAARLYLQEESVYRARRAFENAKAYAEGAAALDEKGYPLLAAELHALAGHHKHAASVFVQSGNYTTASATLIAVGRFGEAVTMLAGNDLLVEAAEAAESCRNAGKKVCPAFEGMPETAVFSRIADACLAARRPGLAAPLLEVIGRNEHAALAYRAAGAFEDAAAIFIELGRPIEAMGALLRADRDDCVIALLDDPDLDPIVLTECMSRLAKLGRDDLISAHARSATKVAVVEPRRIFEVPARAALIAQAPIAAQEPTRILSASRVETKVEPSPLDVPTLAGLERFEILEELGRGGFGVVFKARDRMLDRVVALKLIYFESRSSAEDPALKEARMVAALNHPNIVALHDVFRGDKGLCLVMECMVGGTCESLFKSRLPAGEVLALALQVARGLAHAHEAGIAHRDLKPANLLIAADGSVKISDFGLAKRVVEGESMRIVGTPRYMSPEQRRGEAPNPQSDLYSFGATFFEAATGCRADFVTLRGGDVGQFFETFPGLGDLRPILESCLQEAPAGRPADARALLCMLEAARIDCAMESIAEFNSAITTCATIAPGSNVTARLIA